MIPKFNHTPHTVKHISEHVVASSIINIVFKTNYRFFESQNGPTINEHATQGLHVIMGKAQPTFVHTYRREFLSLSLLHNLVMFFGCHYMCTVMIKHLPYPYPMNIIDVHHLFLPKLLKLKFLHNLHTIVG
jgi:hypothetical protein